MSSVENSIACRVVKMIHCVHTACRFCSCSDAFGFFCNSGETRADPLGKEFWAHLCNIIVGEGRAQFDIVRSLFRIIAAQVFPHAIGDCVNESMS